MPWYHDIMRQTTLRLPVHLADQAEVIARLHGVSINRLVIEALEAHVARLSRQPGFIDEARSQLAREQAVLTALEQPIERRWTSEEFFGNTTAPTDDDHNISADGQLLDSPAALRAHLDEINASRK